MAASGVESSDDADMAYDGSEIVTMQEVLEREQEFEDDANAVLGASDDKNCTYSKGYVKRQAIYACLTCCPDAKTDPSKRAGVCLACSLNCHENHELVELYTKRNFRCDCGNPKFNNHPCQFTPDKTDLNYENKYNQNFSGVYCVCRRPYPDPEATEEQEMIQCVICEDWLHTNHLEATIPDNDQYAEMVCKDCMEDNDFLHDYSDLVINVVDKIQIQLDPDLDVDITSITKETESTCNGDLRAENGISEMKTDDTGNKKDSIEENKESVPNTNDKEDVAMDVGEQKEVKDVVDTRVAETSGNITNGGPEPKTDIEAMETDKSNTDNEKLDNPAAEADKSTEVLPEDASKASSETNFTDQAIGASNVSIPPEEKSEMESVPSIDSVSCQANMTPSETSMVDEADSAKSASVIDAAVSVIDEKAVYTEKTEVSDAGTSQGAPEAESSENKAPESNKNEAMENNVSKELENNVPESCENNAVEANGNSKPESNGNEALEHNETNEQEIKDSREPESNENKRKADQEVSEEDVAVKKPKLDSKPCKRPRKVKRVYNGSTFWPADLRIQLCSCNECIAMYKDLAVLFLIDVDDTVQAYEALGKARENGPASQYERGLEALMSLDRIHQVNALTEYNKMKDKLVELLTKFKERRQIVREEDIRAFFAGMKAKREPDGVYFCR